MKDNRRLTLPTELGAEDASRQLVSLLDADAVRNADGTEIPPEFVEGGYTVYSKYFCNRGDNEWADAHPDELIEIYLLSERVTAAGRSVVIDLMSGYFDEQLRIDVQHDPRIWWEVIDRTTGEVVSPESWVFDAEQGTVTLDRAEAFHEYTVTFLAWNIWDPVQMYNHLINDWGDKEHEKPMDVRHPATREHMVAKLREWLDGHAGTDVVRFTTFFYQFTLIYNDVAKEKYVDWFGYSATVSPAALIAFEREYGYRPRPEAFVDEGYYNSPFRVPSREFLDWMDFVGRYVTECARDMVSEVHRRGKTAMMFLGDQWIGTEPYGERFAEIGLDAVVGSVGSAATCRMISDIPGVAFTEGRLLPYFFPDVFTEGGKPEEEASDAWIHARRAILRKPLDRIGFGGYPSLAVEHPQFLEVAKRIVGEFRHIHEIYAGTRPEVEPIRVAIMNSWGRIRSWQTHMVAHALWYREIYTYQGIVEALAGLPFDVRFVSFDDVRAGALADVDVVINAGDYGTAFSGGRQWQSAELVTECRRFVASGGGFLGIGDPSAWVSGGRTFQLADVLGVDREIGFSLSRDKYDEEVADHFVSADAPPKIDVGEGPRGCYAVDKQTRVLRKSKGSIELAVREYADGRGVYCAGLPYSPQNARLLHRAIVWAARRDHEPPRWWAADPVLDVAALPQIGVLLVANSAYEPIDSTVTCPDGKVLDVTVPAAGMTTVDIANPRR